MANLVAPLQEKADDGDGVGDVEEDDAGGDHADEMETLAKIWAIGTYSIEQEKGPGRGGRNRICSSTMRAALGWRVRDKGAAAEFRNPARARSAVPGP